MKGEKKEYQNKKRLYLLGLCGVLAISGTVYAVTRKSEPQKEQKELVDLNDEGQGVPDEVRDIAQNDIATPVPDQPDKFADGGEEGHTDQIAAGPTPSQPTEQQLTADNTKELNKPGQQDHTKPTTAPVPTTQTALNKPEQPDEKVAKSDQGETTETKVGKSDNAEKTEIKVGKTDTKSEGIKEGSSTEDGAQSEESAQVNNPTAQELKFSEEDGLSWPLSGNVIKNYSTDKLIYFETLGQFKTNPGIFIAGEKGNPIVAAANGIVKEIKKEDKTGQTLILDIGGGYTLTYGQLEEITVKPGDYVKNGQEMAKLARVTKYYRMEGEHLYFQVQKDGENINPLTLIRSE